MTLLQLKIIAVLAMVIDHVGLLFFPSLFWLRWIGRLAFPLFAWTIANGYHYTHSTSRYALRLLAFAIFSQVPFLFFYHEINGAYPYLLNIFFTLAYGLGVIMLYEKTYHASRFGWIFTALAIVGAGILPLEYGLYGVISIFLFHLKFGNKRDMYIVQILWIVFALYIKSVGDGLFFGLVTHVLYAVNMTQLFSLIALPLIYMYTNTPGYTKYKWWFYGFYPVHLMFFVSIARLL